MDVLGDPPLLPDLSHKELALLLQLGERLVSELDLEKVLALVAETACQVVHAETLVVPIIDSEHQTFTYRGASGKYAEIILGQTFPIHEGACGWVLGHRMPLLFGEGGSFGIDTNARWQPGMASSLLVPLICRGAIAGGLSAMGKQGGGAFNQRDLTVLTLFANQASIAIDNARLFQNLGENEARLKLVLDSAAEAIYGVDLNGICTLANPSCLRMLGYASEADLIGKHMHSTIHHSRMDGSPFPMSECSLHLALLKGHQVHTDAEVFWRSDGTSFPVECWSHPKEQDGRFVGAVVTFVDITERKRAEHVVEQYRTVIHASLDGFWITDTSGQILEVNDTICQMHGYSREELLRMSISDVEADETPEETATHIRKMIETGHVQFEARHKRKNGTIVNVEVSIQHLASMGDQLFAFIRDITHIKVHEAELSRAANYDALTCIPNRVLLADRMGQAISQTSREKNMMAVCYLDLDGFKPINDAMGHEAGDEVLVEIAKRIENTIRGGDTVARLGGDEFVVLLLGLEKGDECATTLERLLAAIAQPITVRNKSATISASIGVSIYPLDDEDPDTLLRHADQAMYSAKQSGKNRFNIYDPTLDRRARDQHEFMESIRNGLKKDQFELHYQPKVNMVTKELAGAEALIRWRHPERGLLSPGEFLRYVENTDLDIAIGEWVTATALAQLEHWRNTGLYIEVSINISGYHLESPHFLERLQQQLSQYPDMPFGKLQIEVLETVALNDVGIVRQIIESCRKIGVGFALDDFGTGYSSLSYLSGLPVDTLKIDQSFVRDMLEDKGDMAIVQGIIALARAFDRRTVAEGIETKDHYEILLDMGCELGQGYFIARPIPASEMPKWRMA